MDIEVESPERVAPTRSPIQLSTASPQRSVPHHSVCVKRMVSSLDQCWPFSEGAVSSQSNAAQEGYHGTAQAANHPG